MKSQMGATAVLLALMLFMLGERAQAAGYNLLPATTQASGWTVQQLGGVKAVGDSGGQTNGVRVSVAQVDGTNWHASLVSPPIEVMDGRPYTLTFVARSSAPEQIDYDFTITDGDYHTTGLYARADLTPAWHKFRYTFQAVNSSGHHTHFNFIMGYKPGTVWISSVKCVEGAPMGLSADSADPNSWTLELHDPARATMVQDGNALKVTSSVVDGTDWHIQLYQSGISVAEGQTYTLSFDAKADRLVALGLSATNQTNYQPAGLGVSINLAPSWQRISYTFKAKDLKGALVRVPDINLGGQKCVIWIKNATLVPTN